MPTTGTLWMKAVQARHDLRKAARIQHPLTAFSQCLPLLQAVAFSREPLPTPGLVHLNPGPDSKPYQG